MSYISYLLSYFFKNSLKSDEEFKDTLSISYIMHDIISDHSDKYINKELSESLTKENIIKFINDNQFILHQSVIKSKDIIKRILSKLEIEDFNNLKSIYIHDKKQGYLTLSSINHHGFILSINIGLYT
jgi:hypothetical protein